MRVAMSFCRRGDGPDRGPMGRFREAIGRHRVPIGDRREAKRVPNLSNDLKDFKDLNDGAEMQR